MENNNNSLAKISIGINIALIIAVIILFVKMPSGGNEVADSTDPNDTTKHVLVDDGMMKIGFFQADSLNNLDMMAELEKLGEAAQADAENKMRAKEREIQQWQEKWGDPSKLFPDELRQYQEQAMQKEQEIGMFQQQVQMDLARTQEELMLKLISKVSDASKQFAEDNGYDYILSYQLGQNVYYGSPMHDVTDELITIINDRYNANISSGDVESEVEGE